MRSCEADQQQSALGSGGLENQSEALILVAAAFALLLFVQLFCVGGIGQHVNFECSETSVSCVSRWQQSVLPFRRYSASKRDVFS